MSDTEVQKKHFTEDPYHSLKYRKMIEVLFQFLSLTLVLRNISAGSPTLINDSGSL